MKSLPAKIGAKLDALCAAGDALQNEGDYAGALAKFDEAFALLPDPKTDWEAATWIVAARMDVHFHRGDFAACRDAAQYAFKYCDGALANPFFHLRVGQAYYELDDIENAKQWLTSAWATEGDKLFKGEDPKYRRFLGQILRAPKDEVGE